MEALLKALEPPKPCLASRGLAGSMPFDWKSAFGHSLGHARPASGGSALMCGACTDSAGMSDGAGAMRAMQRKIARSCGNVWFVFIGSDSVVERGS